MGRVATQAAPICVPSTGWAPCGRHRCSLLVPLWTGLRWWSTSLGESTHADAGLISGFHCQARRPGHPAQPTFSPVSEGVSAPTAQLPLVAHWVTGVLSPQTLVPAECTLVHTRPPETAAHLSLTPAPILLGPFSKQPCLLPGTTSSPMCTARSTATLAGAYPSPPRLAFPAQTSQPRQRPACSFLQPPPRREEETTPPPPRPPLPV